MKQNIFTLICYFILITNIWAFRFGNVNVIGTMTCEGQSYFSQEVGIGISGNKNPRFTISQEGGKGNLSDEFISMDLQEIFTYNYLSNEVSALQLSGISGESFSFQLKGDNVNSIQFEFLNQTGETMATIGELGNSFNDLTIENELTIYDKINMSNEGNTSIYSTPGGDIGFSSAVTAPVTLSELVSSGGSSFTPAYAISYLNTGVTEHISTTCTVKNTYYTVSTFSWVSISNMTQESGVLTIESTGFYQIQFFAEDYYVSQNSPAYIRLFKNDEGVGSSFKLGLGNIQTPQNTSFMLPYCDSLEVGDTICLKVMTQTIDATQVNLVGPTFTIIKINE